MAASASDEKESRKNLGKLEPISGIGNLQPVFKYLDRDDEKQLALVNRNMRGLVDANKGVFKYDPEKESQLAENITLKPYVKSIRFTGDTQRDHEELYEGLLNAAKDFGMTETQFKELYGYFQDDGYVDLLIKDAGDKRFFLVGPTEDRNFEDFDPDYPIWIVFSNKNGKDFLDRYAANEYWEEDEDSPDSLAEQFKETISFKDVYRLYLNDVEGKDANGFKSQILPLEFYEGINGGTGWGDYFTGDEEEQAPEEEDESLESLLARWAVEDESGGDESRARGGYAGKQVRNGMMKQGVSRKFSKNF